MVSELVSDSELLSRIKEITKTNVLVKSIGLGL